MKTFEIGVCEEQGGYLQIKAKTKKQAEKIALEYVNNYGLSYCEDYGTGARKVNITHRSVFLV